MHLHILAYGFLPALGTSLHWAIVVITLHVAWSLAVPIGITESLFPEQSTQPWLGRVGLTVTAVLFSLASATIAAFFHRTATHHASARQLAVCTILIVGLIVSAFSFPRPQPMLGTPRVAVAPLWLASIAFLAGSLFVSLYGIGAFVLHWPATITAIAEAGLDALILLLLWKANPRTWTPPQVWAASTGGLLVYAWHGYSVDHALHGSSGTVAHTFVDAALCALQAAAWFRAKSFHVPAT